MNNALKTKMIKKIILGFIIMISIVIVIISTFCFLKERQVAEAAEKLETMYENKYAVELASLDFLTETQKKQFKNKMIAACNAYDLQKVKKIVIDKESVCYDKQTNMYEWSIYCKDSKKTSFLCGFKKSTKAFTIERKYNVELTITEVEQKNEALEKMSDSKDVETLKIKKADAVETCIVTKIEYPDYDYLKTDKQQEKFKKSMESYLAQNGVSGADNVIFDSYNEFSGDVDKSILIFNIINSTPKKVNKVSAKWNDGYWQLVVLY